MQHRLAARLAFGLTVAVALVAALLGQLTTAELAGPGTYATTRAAVPDAGTPAPPVSRVAAQAEHPYVIVSQATSRVVLPIISTNYRFPFTDDFSNPGSGWPTNDDAVATGGYLNGEYRITFKQANWIVRSSPSLSGGDFSAGVDVRTLTPDPNNSYGLYFGQTAAGYYMFQTFPASGNAYLRRYDLPTGNVTLVAGPIPNAIRTGTQTNRLVATRRGSASAVTAIVLYANGVRVISVVDSTFGAGNLGILAASATANFDVRYDNFRATFAGDPEVS